MAWVNKIRQNYPGALPPGGFVFVPSRYKTHWVKVGIAFPEQIETGGFHESVKVVSLSQLENTR